MTLLVMTPLVMTVFVIYPLIMIMLSVIIVDKIRSLRLIWRIKRQQSFLISVALTVKWNGSRVIRLAPSNGIFHLENYRLWGMIWTIDTQRQLLLYIFNWRLCVFFMLCYVILYAVEKQLRTWWFILILVHTVFNSNFIAFYTLQLGVGICIISSLLIQAYLAIGWSTV